MANLPNPPAELTGTSSTVSPAGAILPWYRPGNYYPRPLRAQGPGGIQSGASANPAYPPQTGVPGGQGYTGGAMAAQTTGNANGGGSAVGGAAGQNAIASNPFDFRASPVPLLLIMLVVSILLLRFVHYGY